MSDLFGYADLIGGLLGFILTVLIFTYLLGDNFLFRLAIHLFIGVTVGLAAAVAFYNVILYQLIFPAIDNPTSAWIWLLVLLPGLWLFFTKVSTRFSWLGNWTVAYLVGAAAATAIGGALLGTLFPQIGTAPGLDSLGSDLARWFQAITVLFGTIVTLAYFHFSGRARLDQPPARWQGVAGKLAWAGQFFIAITFGVLFAGVYSAALTALVERVNFILSLINFS